MNEDVFTDCVFPLSGLSYSHESSQWFIQTISRHSEFSLPLTQSPPPHLNSSVCLLYLVWSSPFVYMYISHTHIHYTDGLYCKWIGIVCSIWLQPPHTTDCTWVLWPEIHHPSTDTGCGTCCHEDQVSCCCTVQCYDIIASASEFVRGMAGCCSIAGPS